MLFLEHVELGRATQAEEKGDLRVGLIAHETLRHRLGAAPIAALQSVQTFLGPEEVPVLCDLDAGA